MYLGILNHMKKIINPWRNQEGYNCFGCSPDNPIGLHMEFHEDVLMFGGTQISLPQINIMITYA